MRKKRAVFRPSPVQKGGQLPSFLDAIFNFVEIGNRELQEREMRQGRNRISGEYGMKVWDDNGVACVVHSKLKEKLDTVSEKESALICVLTPPNYFAPLRHLDRYVPLSKDELLSKTGFEAAKLNEMLLFLTENKIAEYSVSNDRRIEGYKLTARRGIVGYMILAAHSLLTSHPFFTSEYLPN